MNIPANFPLMSSRTEINNLKNIFFTIWVVGETNSPSATSGLQNFSILDN